MTIGLVIALVIAGLSLLQGLDWLWSKWRGNQVHVVRAVRWVTHQLRAVVDSAQTLHPIVLTTVILLLAATVTAGVAGAVVVMSDARAGEPGQRFAGSGPAAVRLPLRQGLVLIHGSRSEGSGSLQVALKTLEGDLLSTRSLGLYSTDVLEGTVPGYVAVDGDYLLDIDAKGPWEVRVSQPHPGDAPSPPQSFSGNGGFATTPFFRLNGGGAVFRFDFQGDSNFIVHLLDTENNVVLAANEIGFYKAEVTQSLPEGTYFFFLDSADGPWSIEVLAGATDADATAQSSPVVLDPYPPGFIAFVSEGETAADIIMMRPDGSDREKVGYSSSFGNLSCAPEGSRLAFTRWEGGSIVSSAYPVLYILHLNSGNEVRINSTDTPGGLSWAPDGEQLVFDTSGYVGSPGPSDIIVIEDDGSSQVTIDDGSSITSPAWSPDGQWIAAGSGFNLATGTDIVLLSPDGSRVARVTETARPTGEGSPAWSPDGNRIAYEVYEGSANPEIYVMNSDGTAAVNITNNPAHDASPIWSPDGEYIAFVSDRDGNDEIYMVRPDGSNPQNVTRSPENDFTPTWCR